MCSLGVRRTAGVCGLALVSTWLFAGSAWGQTHGMALLVPAYFYPETNGPWAELARAAARVPLVAILNPINGPGTAVNRDYQKAAQAVRSGGGRVIGYVYTSYGARSLAQVKLDMDRFAQFYPVDGFFIDEMSNEASLVRYDYYQAIYRYAKAKDPRHLVIGNPGTNTEETYLKQPAVDGLVIFENHSGYGQFQPSAWTRKYTPCAFTHLLYDIPDAATMTNSVDLAAARNAGIVYVTDAQGVNPWDRLPSYWQAEVDHVEARNRQAANQAPPQLSIQPGTNATLSVVVRGAAGRHSLESSLDLRTWAPLATNLSSCSGFSVTITNPGSTARGYYRSRQ
jgi:hypothetical protein